MNFNCMNVWLHEHTIPGNIIKLHRKLCFCKYWLERMLASYPRSQYKLFVHRALTNEEAALNWSSCYRWFVSVLQNLEAGNTRKYLLYFLTFSLLITHHRVSKKIFMLIFLPLFCILLHLQIIFSIKSGFGTFTFWQNSATLFGVIAFFACGAS